MNDNILVAKSTLIHTVKQERVLGAFSILERQFSKTNEKTTKLDFPNIIFWLGKET